MDDRNVLAVDIGGSKYMAAIVQESGRIKHLVHGEWPALTGEAVLGEITKAAKTVLSMHIGAISAVGATIPGLADPRAGHWVEASFSGLTALDVAGTLSAVAGQRCFVENDANACALAEATFGGGIGIDDFLYATVSNGIGGGAFCAGRLYYGAYGNAMELGHFNVAPGGRRCGCGSLGCLEMHAAGPGLVKNYLELGGPALIAGEKPTAKSIAERAKQGDEAARKAYAMTGHFLGAALAAAVNLFNPEKIILGGGIAQDFDLFRAALERTLTGRIYKRANAELTIEPTELGYYGALLGAAATAFARLDNRFFINDEIERIWGRNDGE